MVTIDDYLVADVLQLPYEKIVLMLWYSFCPFPATEIRKDQRILELLSRINDLGELLERTT